MKTLTIPRITISAPHRSSGKSTLTIGVCAALSARGLKVQAFKKGPDFIDPMWHEAATGRDSHNLDLFMMGPEVVRSSFQRHASLADISVIEGNMGLFDGMDIEGSDSTAGLSRLVGAPVILVVDCEGMTRGIAPLVKGFEDFEPGTNVMGVILNRVKGSRHESKLRAAVERYCDAKVIGALPHEDGMGIAMRHLGLVPLKEELGLASTVVAIRDAVAKGVDLDALLDMARGAKPFEAVELPDIEFPVPDVRIGVARDRAFTFYYPENLDALRLAGAELVEFSPISDTKLPEVDALYIGGGFPEAHMGALEANGAMRESVRGAVESGMPVYAECGGLMYLCRDITWKGETRAMAGVFPCGVEMSARPAGHGYVALRPTGAGQWPPFAQEVKGHEFHHSSLTGFEGETFAYEVRRGKGVDGRQDGMTRGRCLAGYTHVHALGTPGWAEIFVGFVREATSKGR